MSNLRTDYKDDVFTGSRKYQIVNNQDSTVSFEDVTEYEQQGDTYGAAQINEVNDIINNLDDNAFLNTDSVETTIADNDYFPFYDTSASGTKKTLWSNIKTILTNVFAIKQHASNTNTTYGAGNASQFGHIKLSDAYTSNGGAASASIGASSQAVYNAYNKLNNQLKANSKEIYMDYKDGKYGYNTSANRGADTFHPFNSLENVEQIYHGTFDVTEQYERTIAVPITLVPGTYYLFMWVTNGYYGDNTWNYSFSNVNTSLSLWQPRAPWLDKWCSFMVNLVKATGTNTALTFSGDKYFSIDIPEEITIWKLT